MITLAPPVDPEIAALPEYSLSVPSLAWDGAELVGVKRWRRATPQGWRIGEYDVANAHPDKPVRILWT